jgi:hypothetical protein
MTYQNERTVRYLSTWLLNIQGNYQPTDFETVKEITVSLVSSGLTVRQVQKLFVEN